MQLEIGSIVEGKVTGITKFGAFVEMEGGTVGLVHISEVSTNYVNDISEHLKAQQVVKVKVLSVGGDGKVSLSIKKAMPQSAEQPPRRDNNAVKPGFSKPSFNKPSFNNNNRNSSPPNRNSRPTSQFSQSAGPKPMSNTFDDMLSKFLQTSDEKNSDTKREKSSRRGAPKRTRDYD